MNLQPSIQEPPLKYFIFEKHYTLMFETLYTFLGLAQRKSLISACSMICNSSFLLSFFNILDFLSIKGICCGTDHLQVSYVVQHKMVLFQLKQPSISFEKSLLLIWSAQNINLVVRTRITLICERIWTPFHLEEEGKVIWPPRFFQSHSQTSFAGTF